MSARCGIWDFPVEEIDTPLAEIFNYITEYLTGGRNNRVSQIFIAYRCPGGPGGRNRLSPRFSTIYEIFSDDIFFISDVSTVPRWKKYLAWCQPGGRNRVSEIFIVMIQIFSTPQKVKNLSIIIVIAYRCPGGRNGLLPRFSTIWDFQWCQ